MKNSKGFTLIEILIVIVLLGILAVAVLSAINPLEQIRKARDSGRKSDSAELLSAYERYYTTFGCYPWDTACTGAILSPNTANPAFGDGENSIELITKNELKSQFADRDSLVELWVTETDEHLVSICFEPEATTGREGGSGETMDITNTTETDCGTAGYVGDGSGVCFVCVPQ